MKKHTILIMLFVFISILIFICINTVILQLQHNSTVYSEFVDYPLIDQYFLTENEWIIINRVNLFTENEECYIIQDKQILEETKEYLKVQTYPVGRGITPNGILYIYKDKELIKEISYIDVYFTLDKLKNAFILTTKEVVEKEFDINIPPSI